MNSHYSDNELRVPPSLDAAMAGDVEAQYETGFFWIMEGKYQDAERWLRYAAHKGNALAKRLLRDGIRLGFFLEDKKRIHELAANVLENMITPNPLKQDIVALDGVITQHLHESFGYKNLSFDELC
jgi:TPR repeat protein